MRPPPDGHDVVGSPAEHEAQHQDAHDLHGLHLGATDHSRPQEIKIQTAGSPKKVYLDSYNMQ